MKRNFQRCRWDSSQRRHCLQIKWKADIFEHYHMIRYRSLLQTLRPFPFETCIYSASIVDAYPFLELVVIFRQDNALRSFFGSFSILFATDSRRKQMTLTPLVSCRIWGSCVETSLFFTCHVSSFCI